MSPESSEPGPKAPPSVPSPSSDDARLNDASTTTSPSQFTRPIWWGWPLRLTSQFLPLVYSQWGYTCMQLVDCRMPATAAERRTVHIVLAIMVAIGVEIVLLFARLLDDPPPEVSGRSTHASASSTPQSHRVVSPQPPRPRPPQPPQPQSPQPQPPQPPQPPQ